MKAFIRLQFYRREHKGMRHLEHVFRVRTQKKLSNKIEVYGDSLEDVMKNYAKAKNVRNWYLEIMVGKPPADKIEEIYKYLKERFKGHKIVIVRHLDESQDHIHCLINWCSAETGKSLFLHKSEFTVNGTIYRDIARICGHEITPKGQGRPRISLKSYEAWGKEKVNEMIEKIKERDEKALKFIEKMLKLYGKLKISVLKEYRVDVQEISDVREVNLRKLRALEKNGWGVYFSPVYNEKGKAVFLDDIPEEMLEQLPKGSIVVQTSQGKYQAHIPVPVEAGDDVLQEYQKYLIKKFKADKGASSIKQLRRLAYFVNQKYLDKPEVKEVDVELKGDSWSLYNEFLKAKISEIQAQENYIQIVNKKVKDLSNLKTWEDFAREYGLEKGYIDESEVDARFVFYLCRKGFSDEEIKEALKAQSRDLFVRKAGHVEDYLDRTVRKGRKFYEEWRARKKQELEREIEEVAMREIQKDLQEKVQMWYEKKKSELLEFYKNKLRELRRQKEEELKNLMLS